jgi:hypothetical protein
VYCICNRFAMTKQTRDKQQNTRSDGCSSPLTASLPADRGPTHGFQLAGKHGWVSAVVTGVCWRIILGSVQIWNESRLGPRESERMQIRLKYLTPLLAAGAAAAAIATAPAALAAPTAAANPPQAQESCIDLSSGSQCQSPGNVQINDSPAGPIYPYYGYYPYYGATTAVITAATAAVTAAGADTGNGH